MLASATARYTPSQAGTAHGFAADSDIGFVSILLPPLVGAFRSSGCPEEEFH